MQCARCRTWIHPGYEVVYQKRFYHKACSISQSNDDKAKDKQEIEAAERAIRARRHFKSVIGRK